MKTKKIVCYNCGGHGFITTTYENGQTSAICPVCGGIGTHEIQMTNADRIRAMSDKELAELMRSMMGCDSCGNMFSFKCDGSYEHCLSVCLKWLQQPAEEDKHETD